MVGLPIVLALALQQAPAQAPPRPAQPPATTPAQPAPGTSRPAAPRPRARVATTLQVRVTNQSGIGLEGARVTALGPSSEQATTDEKGEATIRPLTAGNYRVRVEHDGHITLEKELTVRAGAVTSASFALNLAPVEEEPAPPPPPPPPPAPTPPPLGARGEPRTLALTDLAERSLDGRDPVKVVPIACTGNTATRLIVLRDALPPAAYEDADETLYLMAGEAAISMEGSEQSLSPGWMSVIPRGTSFGLARKGRNPALLLSVLNGRPCPAPTTASAR